MNYRVLRLPRKRAVQMPWFLIAVPRTATAAAVFAYRGSVPCKFRDHEYIAGRAAPHTRGMESPSRVRISSVYICTYVPLVFKHILQMEYDAMISIQYSPGSFPSLFSWIVWIQDASACLAAASRFLVIAATKLTIHASTIITIQHTDKRSEIITIFPL